MAVRAAAVVGGSKGCGFGASACVGGVAAVFDGDAKDVVGDAMGAAASCGDARAPGGEADGITTTDVPAAAGRNTRRVWMAPVANTGGVRLLAGADAAPDGDDDDDGIASPMSSSSMINWTRRRAAGRWAACAAAAGLLSGLEACMDDAKGYVHVCTAGTLLHTGFVCRAGPSCLFLLPPSNNSPFVCRQKPGGIVALSTDKKEQPQTIGGKKRVALRHGVPVFARTAAPRRCVKAGPHQQSTQKK
ncbi:hypothetical protein TW95_gp1488 [Pandoravirus inopinatum]|uniref:Uncharacterized protein n=1 Tax=Pandoravirus inopinatum TaxID=1605721 RepID=A0A0B5JEM4_9VIRU|nr:hypothetical protein TW95_gp1488 [Pandoravirus inopinatum]AJF98222.1 hypothetical protein [Pandoravirus inopinatum]